MTSTTKKLNTCTQEYMSQCKTANYWLHTIAMQAHRLTRTREVGFTRITDPDPAPQRVRGRGWNTVSSPAQVVLSSKSRIKALRIPHRPAIERAMLRAEDCCTTQEGPWARKRWTEYSSCSHTSSTKWVCSPWGLSTKCPTPWTGSTCCYRDTLALWRPKCWHSTCACSSYPSPCFPWPSGRTTSTRPTTAMFWRCLTSWRSNTSSSCV